MSDGKQPLLPGSITDEKVRLKLQLKLLEKEIDVLKQRLHAHEAENSKLEVIFRESLDVIAVVDGPSGTILDINDACYQALGYRKEQLTGELFALLLGDEEEAQLMGGVLTSRHMVKEDGSSIPVDMTLNVIDWGGHKAIVVTARDTTERVEAEQKIQSYLKELAEKNVIITAANEKILASLTYAQRIQSAMLPDQERITDAASDHFLIYRPRDIVSGDFVWAYTSGSVRLIAVADCTGHGVPGALVSMIGISLLNLIVIEEGITSPAEILAALRIRVRESLQQRGGEDEVQDGMDIGICSIDADNCVFAGARRPLYYIENGILKTVKGDRLSVGGFRRKEDRDFMEHTIPLKKAERFFLTSDGFADQQNSANERFGSARFRELLASSASQPLEKQYELVEAALLDHMEGEDQRDDITILGFSAGASG